MAEPVDRKQLRWREAALPQRRRQLPIEAPQLVPAAHLDRLAEPAVPAEEEVVIAAMRRRLLARTVGQRARPAVKLARLHAVRHLDAADES